MMLTHCSLHANMKCYSSGSPSLVKPIKVDEYSVLYRYSMAYVRCIVADVCYPTVLRELVVICHVMTHAKLTHIPVSISRPPSEFCAEFEATVVSVPPATSYTLETVPVGSIIVCTEGGKGALLSSGPETVELTGGDVFFLGANISFSLTSSSSEPIRLFRANINLG
jgi:hypothetical protein